MKRLISLAAVVSLAALGGVASAAQKPDFTGIWVAVSPARFAGQEIKIEHDETSLTVLLGFEEGHEHGNIYELNGKPERDVSKSHDDEIVTVTTASWKGNRIVVARVITSSTGRKVESKLTFSLNAKGQLLQELSETVNGEQQPTVTLVSRKKPEPQRPNFSGTWIAVTPASMAGEEEKITHTAALLMLDHGSEGGHGHNVVYRLDGRPASSTMPSHGEEIRSTAMASWDGDQLLIIRTTKYPDGRTVQSKLTYSLNAQDQLVTEITDIVDGILQPTIKGISRRKK